MTPVTFEAAAKHPIIIPPLELASFSSLSRHSRSICPVNGFSSRLITRTSIPPPSRFLQGKRFEWCSWGEASTVTWRPLSIHSKHNYFSLGFLLVIAIFRFGSYDKGRPQFGGQILPWFFAKVPDGWLLFFLPPFLQSYGLWQKDSCTQEVENV